MRQKRILVVDDEVGFTRLLKLNLEQTREYEVLIVNWAEEALPAARQFRPDLVLLDVIMPRQVGGDVAAQLRADPELKKTPILFFTAAVSRTRIIQHDGVISGFPVLAKPASVEEIIARIEQLLGDERFRGQSTADPAGFSELVRGATPNGISRPLRSGSDDRARRIL